MSAQIIHHSGGLRGHGIYVCSNKEPSPSQNTLSISLKKSYPVSSH